MITEIIKGVIAVIVLVAAIAALFLGDSIAQTFLTPLATFAIGYYFKQVEAPVANRLKAAFGGN